MKRLLLIWVYLFIYQSIINAQAIYIDCNFGDDKNPGTKESPVYSIHKAAEIINRKDNNFYVIKINPGIYILDKYLSVQTGKTLKNKRISIEASILPDDSAWTPEKMPVIVSKSKKGEIPEDKNFAASFIINESHITIKGLKFHGYFYPNTRYFPIARFNKTKTDLSVEQCMFVGDANASHIQVGIIAHGNEIKIDHCVFYNVKNAVVYWQDSGSGSKTGNSFTNCIVYGGFQCAIWTAWPDSDFIFKNNVITNCKHAWIKNNFNKTKYTIENSIIVNNKYYKGITSDAGVQPGEFELVENNVVKTGEISLKMIDDLDAPLPKNYLHVISNTLGYDLGAGLFKYRKL